MSEPWRWPCTWCGDAYCTVHCIWCGIPCDDDDPVHAIACPQTTGIFPADEPMLCARCLGPIPEMEPYALIDTDDDPSTGLVVCLGCKIESEVRA